jgi:alkylation response protein AidB-like acyl-CoA dehydrogenase
MESRAFVESMTLLEISNHQYPFPNSTLAPTEFSREIGLELRPFVAEHDRTGEISHAAFDLLRSSGMTAALVPREFGGGGVTHAEMGAMLRELGRHDPATAVTLSMHSHVLAAQVWRHNHGMDAEAAFRKVVEDKAVFVNSGASDWVGSTGEARRVDGGFRVSARKSPISGCEVGTILATSVRWDSAPDGPSVIHCTIPCGAQGVSIETTWDTLGLRATGSHTVVFDDVLVPDEAVSLIRPADVWHPIWNTVLGGALPLIMSAYLGIADEATDLARSTVDGRSDHHVLQLVGEMMNAHTTAADVVAGMFADAENLHFDNTDQLASRTLSRKTIACQSVIETVRIAIEVTGGLGYTRSSDLERLYRDVHGCLFHPLPRAKQLRFTGRVELGLDPVS